MTDWNRRSRRRTTRRAPGGVEEAAARAKRARDHLARKRDRERRRLERARARTARSDQRAQVRGVLTPLAFALAFVVGLGGARPIAEIFLLRVTPLERVAVQGARSLSPAAIAASAGVVAGFPLASVDPHLVRERVAANPWIESVRALRLPTGTLVVSVVERRAVARWQDDPSEPMELIDQRGQRFAGAIEPGGALPLVRGAIDRADSLPSEAIEILDELRRHRRLAAAPDALTLHLPDRRSGPTEAGAGYELQIGDAGPRAILGRRQLSQRIARLAALLEDGAAPLGDSRWIDLRYADRAVLRAEPVSG
jgi:cell division protein FtsQ